MAIAIVHETDANYISSGVTSGSITIPATTPGNLLVFLVASSQEPPAGNPYTLTLSTNTSDVFTQVKFSTLPSDQYAAGQMFGFKNGASLSSMSQLDCWYVASGGGTTTINWTCPKVNGGAQALLGVFWIFELSGVSQWGVIDYEAAGNLVTQNEPYLGPSLNGTATDNVYFCLMTTSGGINFGNCSVGGPWFLDPYPAPSPGCSTALAYIVDSVGIKQASFTAPSFDPTDIYQSVGIVFGFSSNSPGIPVTGGGGGSGGGPSSCSSTLNISPATELYQVFTPASAMALSSYTTEGRTAVVIDFNAGDGLYSRDIETMFAWGLSSHYAVRVWQPSLIQEPENQFNRPTDWNDGGSPGNKFIQGITIEADSFNLPKSFQLQSADDLSLHALNEMPATFIKQTIKTFSCVTPFLAHSIRIFATDGVAWRVWDSTPIFQPWPSQVMNWQTEQTSFGMQGWLHAREMNIAYASSQPITIVLDPDTGPTITLTLPSTGGPLIQAKTKQTLPPMKFKLLSMQVVSTAPFYLFEQDIEFKIKAWGSDGPYNVLKIVGGESRTGAKV